MLTTARGRSAFRTPLVPRVALLKRDGIAMRPFFRALSKPLTTRSLIISRSNSVNVPNRGNMREPVGVVVSIAS